MSTAPGPEDLADLGLDPSWSRILEVPSWDGGSHAWHILDRPGTSADGSTVICLHGNPTWSGLWARLFSELDGRHRLVAPDHLSMGFSEHVGGRNYEARVKDVLDLIERLDLHGPVWLVGQDWGGAIAMGVASRLGDRIGGMILSNTGIAIPAGRRAPVLIRIAAARGLHRIVTEKTSLFVRGTTRLPGMGLTRGQRQGLLRPYRDAARRRGVAGFVADVPFDDNHPSSGALADVAGSLGDLSIPVRLVWGARDVVFDDSFAEDLMARFSDARLHRIPQAGHLAVLETSIAGIVEDSIREAEAGSGHTTDEGSTDGVPGGPIWSDILDNSGSSKTGVADAKHGQAVSWEEFSENIGGYAGRLMSRGVRPGHRVALLIEPGVDMLGILYALWRIGAVAVVADKGLGLGGLGRALRSARAEFTVGPGKALLAARVLGWARGATHLSLRSLKGVRRPLSLVQAENAGMDAPAAVVFTSGATGPAKGVRYTHRQLCATREALRGLYAIEKNDSLVAAFAPFSVFGPALGITTGLVDMDITKPATLSAENLEAACRAAGGTLVFASPAALENVVRTASGAHPALGRVRLVLSAGAPVPRKVLEGVSLLCPEAEIRTPYGMTEVMPVADVSLEARDRIGSGRGVCVGTPVRGCEVRIARHGDGTSPEPVGTCGEILVRAPWMSSGYDRLWHTEHRSRPVIGGRIWHRTGDLGHLDAEGNLWVEGRVVHLIETLAGEVSPVPIELAAESVNGVRKAAAVGVGPRGLMQVVVVVERETGETPRRGPAEEDLTRRIRKAVTTAYVAAVWVVDRLPVDIRHNSKIDRGAVGLEMERNLRGGRR